MKNQIDRLRPEVVKVSVLGLLFVASFITAWWLVSDSEPNSEKQVAIPVAKQDEKIVAKPEMSQPSVSMVKKARRFETGTPTLSEAKELLQSGEASKELLALDLTEGLSESEAWIVFHAVSRSKSAQVRAAVVELAAEMGESLELNELLKKAVADNEALVGFTALDVAEKLPKTDRNKVFQHALESALPEIGTTVLGDLEIQGDHSAIDILVRGLDSIMVETRQETQMTLELMFDENFSNATEATAWWQSNKVRYDRDLVLKD